MTVATSHPHGPRVKRWSKDEYNDQVEQGWFEGKRLFLFRGELIEMPAMGAPHALAIVKLSRELMNAFPNDDVRIQLPFEVPGDSMPEPDATVVAKEDGSRRPHPNRALLVVEVSDSSYDLDVEKAREYAAAGVQDYWIVDLNRAVIELYCQPVADPTAALGYRYAERSVVPAHESARPLANAGCEIRVGELCG